MYHKIRLNSTYCCVALQKDCTFFTKKHTFVCIKNRKRKAKALRLCGFSVSCCTAAGALRFIRPLPHHRWGAAFCHISCRGCDMPRFVISLPSCGCDTLRFAISPAATRRVLSYLLPRLRHAAFCHISCRGCSAAFCHIPAALRPRRGVFPCPCRAAVCHAPALLSAA